MKGHHKHIRKILSLLTNDVVIFEQPAPEGHNSLCSDDLMMNQCLSTMPLTLRRSG